MIIQREWIFTALLPLVFYGGWVMREHTHSGHIYSLSTENQTMNDLFVIMKKGERHLSDNLDNRFDQSSYNKAQEAFTSVRTEAKSRKFSFLETMANNYLILLSVIEISIKDHTKNTRGDISDRLMSVIESCSSYENDSSYSSAIQKHISNCYAYIADTALTLANDDLHAYATKEFNLIAQKAIKKSI